MAITTERVCVLILALAYCLWQSLFHGVCGSTIRAIWAFHILSVIPAISCLCTYRVWTNWMNEWANACRNMKEKCQRLEPGHSALYTWQDPMGKRELIWRSSDQDKEFKDELIKVTFISSWNCVLLSVYPLPVHWKWWCGSRFLSVCLSIFLSVCLSVSLSVCMSVCVYIFGTVTHMD